MIDDSRVVSRMVCNGGGGGVVVVVGVCVVDVLAVECCQYGEL